MIGTNVQVGIVSFGAGSCYNHRFPNGFARVSEVADWVKETVCSKTGELCKPYSKVRSISFISYLVI